MDRISGMNGGVSGGVGLPPPSKFRSGHLPANVIPLSTRIPVRGEDSVSNSEMGSESGEDDVYGGRYSMESSPQDQRMPTTSLGAQRYANVVQRRTNYASDISYSDVSSSRETLFGRQDLLRERAVKGTGKYPVRQSGFTEDESSDSATSSEFSTTQVGSMNGAASRSRVSEGYASSVYMERVSAAKGMYSKNKKLSDDDDDDNVPTAPPFSGATQEIRELPSKSSTSGAHTSHLVSKAREISIGDDSSAFKPASEDKMEENITSKKHDQFSRATAGSERVTSSVSSARLPTFHASTLGPWHATVAYEACVRFCLHAWAMQCMEAPIFLENECALLRDAFSVRYALLQSVEELMANRSSQNSSDGIAPKPRKVVGKMKVQVRKIKVGLDAPTGCSITSIRTPTVSMESIRNQFSNFQSTMCFGWQALRRANFKPNIPAFRSLHRKGLKYVHASTRYIQQVSGVLKDGVTSLRNNSSSYEVVQEMYSCLLRLKSSAEVDAVRMQPGSSETHVFLPDSQGDDLIIEVLDSVGKHVGRITVQVAAIADDPTDKVRWWSLYHERDHEPVGKAQLYICYSTSDDNGHLKCGTVAETVAYDIVLEVAMKVQHFQQRNLLLHGPWKWLLTEFASYYGVSDVYTKLRYLSYVMDVATPTEDCLSLVYELLMPVIMKGHSKTSLSHQENRILGEIKDQVEQILTLVFENYKSLDEASSSGIIDVFGPASGVVAPALEPAVKLYKLLYDILSPEVQLSFCRYFQVAAKKRSKRHMTETDEYVTSNFECSTADSITVTTAYLKMKTLCMNIKHEIVTDIQIHNKNILPSFMDLPNLSASIYSTELCSRLRAFLIACPPVGPSLPVAELVIATSDFQRDLSSWNIGAIKGGVDAKELFHMYILLWIQDKRRSLLESCKLDKVKWSGVRTQHCTTPFLDDMYERLKETLTDYEVIICRWPEYTMVLESAIADIEKAVVEALERQYADVLSPLKETMTPKKFGLKYVQKLAKRSVCPYTVPDELGILLNSMKRMLDMLRPKIESQFKSWASCMPSGGNAAPGERLSEVTVMLRATFRNYQQAVVEKLMENTRLQNNTKLKKILQDSKGTVVESDIRARMQPLKDFLGSTISHLHTVFESHVFITICRGFWDRMGQEVLNFLENRKENRSWYKGSRIAVSILDDAFASQMQQRLGNSLHEKDVEPPRSIMEVRSMLCRDAANVKDDRYYY